MDSIKTDFTVRMGQVQRMVFMMDSTRRVASIARSPMVLTKGLYDGLHKKGGLCRDAEVVARTDVLATKHG